MRFGWERYRTGGGRSNRAGGVAVACRVWTGETDSDDRGCGFGSEAFPAMMAAAATLVKTAGGRRHPGAQADAAFQCAPAPSVLPLRRQQHLPVRLQHAMLHVESAPRRLRNPSA